MRSTFYGLEIAKTGLFTAQTQLDLTGHNMSNTSTAGYTRQRVVSESLSPSVGTRFVAEDYKSTAGRGVSTVCIQQIRNPFLDYQYRKENSTTSMLTTKEQYFEYVESLFNNELDEMDKSSGLTNIFKGFYSSLYALTEAPADTEIRANVKENAIKLTESMNYYYSKLMEQQDTLNESVKITVDEINELADQISILNQQIFAFELNGAMANDLRDKRNNLLDTLSGLVKIDTYEDINGQLAVKTGGRTLIHHTSTSKLVVAEDVDNPIGADESKLYGIYWADSDGNPTSSALNVETGALRGYLTIRDGDAATEVGIPHVMDLLDAVCKKIVEQFNTVHNQGYTVPIGNNETQTGVDFFDAACVRAKDIKLSAAVMESVYNIAASDMPVGVDDEENAQMGNAKNVLAMCELITKTNAEGKPDNLNSTYKEMLSVISVELNHIHTTANTQTVMLAHVESQRKSISNVSLDEEMTNMIRFNHAYSAASRMITTIDEGLDTVINKMGLVGR